MARTRSFNEHQDGTLHPFKYMLPIKFMVGVGVLVGSLLPWFVSLPLALLMLSGTLVKGALSLAGYYQSPFSKQVVRGRKTAKIEGDFVVFHIGARPNRNVDQFYKWMGEAMESIQKELEDNPEIGCLGGERFVGATGPVLIQYWRSLDHLLAYSRGATQHAGPWAKLMQMGRSNADYGFYHETFEVKAGNYETIYVNCPPILLGNCHEVDLVQCEGGTNTAAGRVGKSDGTDYVKERGIPDY